MSFIKRYAFLMPLILASIPMVIYPALLVADAMSLAGEPGEHPQEPTLQGMLFKTFLYASALYPIPLGLSWYCSWIQLKKSVVRAFLIGMCPLIYLLLTVFILMTALGPTGRAQLFGN